jgi:hypothetical protein
LEEQALQLRSPETSQWSTLPIIVRPEHDDSKVPLQNLTKEKPPKTGGFSLGMFITYLKFFIKNNIANDIDYGIIYLLLRNKKEILKAIFSVV